MSNNIILAQISQYASALHSAALWHNSGTTIAKVGLKQGEKNGGDYIYEFYCYIRVLSDLIHNYDVEFVEGKGAYKMIFPQAPSLKEGKPYFILKNSSTGEIEFQVCAGTKIATRFASRQPAPDISFQKPDASSFPKYTDVLLILDAKFNRSDSEKEKIGLEQLYYVAGMVRDLELENACDVEIQFDELSSLKGNCLLTNGAAHSIDADYNKHHCVMEVEHFTVGASFKVIG